MKLLVETKGDIQLHGPGAEQWVRFNRPSVVRESFFITRAVSKGEAVILGQLSDDATDAGFVAFKGTPTEYLAKYPLVPVAAPEPLPPVAKTRGAAKPAA